MIRIFSFLALMTFAYLGHRKLTLESTPHSVINTLWFPPCLLNTLVSVGLVAPKTKVSALPRDILQELDTLERLGALLDDRDADHGGLLYRESAKESRVQIGGK